MSLPQLSVLDLVPVRSDQTTSAAINASVELAKVADAQGYRRYWLAEHHNMPAVAATNPPLLISMIAGATSRMRVGSGGVMLPNHSPLVVAEQFALLEAAFPGRIDLGIGRAPGTDPLTRYVLRMGANESVDQFPQYVDQIIAMMSPGGARVDLGPRHVDLRATPQATGSAPVWLLGSSDYSARLAAARGLPYVFAHHFAGKGTAEALALYRDTFQPSEHLAEPRTFLTVNAVVADTKEEADRLALPQLLAMMTLHTGGPLRAQRLIEDAEAVDVPEQHRRLLDAMRRKWVIDDSVTARERITNLASEFGVDEVMIHPVGGAYQDTPADRSPAREQTLLLLSS